MKRTAAAAERTPVARRRSVPIGVNYVPGRSLAPGLPAPTGSAADAIRVIEVGK